MDEKLIRSYLDNIAELVVDEDKIVTYKSLSKSLGIHVNTAKQLLYTYLIEQKAQNAFPISATYLLAGQLADGSFSISIVNDSELESTSRKFIQVTSEHVYSVQKGKNVREVNMLCGADKGMQERNILVITSSKCVLKSMNEVKKEPDSHKQENKEAIKKAFGAEQEKVSLEESNKKVESPVKNEIKSPKKVSPKNQKEKNQGNIKKTGGNIANMFAKVAQKNLENPKNVKIEEKDPRVSTSVEELETAKSERDKSIANIFDRAGQKNAKSINNIHVTEIKSECDSSSDEAFEVVRPKRSKKRTSKLSPKKTNRSKRKRICTNSDSNDSETNDGEPPQAPPVEEDDSESLPEAAVLREDENPIESQPLNKRKKRKIVDKMVMHDDGYLETKKEIVFETDSDDAEEEPKADKKTKPIAKPKSVTTNAAKKQSSLLTFFKKS